MLRDSTKTYKLKQRHIDILLLLYRFRFLTRQQCQTLLHHKHHRKVSAWLTELVDLTMIKKHDRLSVIDAAVYSLNTEGRKYLKERKLVKNPAELDRVWRESSYSHVFREKCIELANFYIQLERETGGVARYWAKTDLAIIDGLIRPLPDAYFIIGAKRYFLDLFAVAPGKVLRARVDRYADFCADGDWQERTKTAFPEIIILCPSQSAAKSLRRYIREEYSDAPDLHFLVSSDRTLSYIIK